MFSLFLTSSFTADVDVSEVNITEGASLESSTAGYEPKVIKIKIGTNNTVRWTNHDIVPHGVTSDNGYRDPATGEPFDVWERSTDKGGPFIMPGETYEFTFREPGEFAYHMEPHPWMRGIVMVVPAFP
jgi:plastocyanin